MLAAILTILALLGGVSVTFFIMDAPRRRAMELRRRLGEELDAARRLIQENEDRSARLASKASELREARTALDRRETAFDRRAIAYDDLVTENRIIKVDLRNMALLVRQSEALAEAVADERTTLTSQRDLLAQAYLEEVRATTRRTLTVSNYPTSKRRLEGAIARLIEAGVQPTPAGRRQLMEELQRQYEAAVRASVEREQQALIRERIREEQRREREAQTAIEQAERERLAIQKALDEAMAKAAGQHAAEVELLSPTAVVAILCRARTCTGGEAWRRG